MGGGGLLQEPPILSADPSSMKTGGGKACLHKCPLRAAGCHHTARRLRRMSPAEGSFEAPADSDWLSGPYGGALIIMSPSASPPTLRCDQDQTLQGEGEGKGRGRHSG